MGLKASQHLLQLSLLIACILLVYLASLNFILADYSAAAAHFSGSCALLLLVFVKRPNLGPQQQSFFNLSIFIFYSLATLLLLLNPQQKSLLSMGAYLTYPLIVFMLLPFKNAVVAVLVFALAANLVLMLQLNGLVRVAYLSVFWGNVFLTCLHSFAAFKRQETLTNKLNRETKTQLLNKFQLGIDLHKEQQRAIREGTYLGLIYIQNSEDFTFKLAQMLHKHLASYEKLYFLEAKTLIALIPLASADSLFPRCEELRQAVPDFTYTPQLSKASTKFTTELEASL